MSENSNIEWTDHTFNPWIGCTKVSPGCANCYAESQDKFRSWTPEGWGKGKPRKRTSKSNWNKPRIWNRSAGKALEAYEWEAAHCQRNGIDFQEHWEQAEEYHGYGPIRPRVFCASLADWLDDEVHSAWLTDLLKLISETENLDWLLLTKRPENWSTRLQMARHVAKARDDKDLFNWIDQWLSGHAPGNIWIGTSAEDQERWDSRMPSLKAIPARVHFISAEPLLGPIHMGTARPDWLIVGGESGPNAREMKDIWVHHLLGQSGDETAFFFKQWGGVNKKKAGRILDGQVWDELPTPRTQNRREDSK